MNRGAIRTKASGFVQDQNQTRFSTTQYNEAIDTAAQEFAFDSRALWKDAATYTTVEDDPNYDLPSDFWLEKRVTHKGLELKPVSRATLLKESGDDWTDDEGTPKRYIIDAEEARKALTLYPIPQADDIGANLILTYYPIPADIGSDSESPLNGSSLMAQFHLGIAAKAAVLLLLQESQTPEIAMKINRLEGMYQEKVSMAIDRFGDKAQESWALEPKRRYRSRP